MEELLTHHDDTTIMGYDSFVGLIGICQNNNSCQTRGSPNEQVLGLYLRWA